MRQVADLAGVSVKTVSRVINDEPNVSAQLKDRVEEAIVALGWRPSSAARTVRTGVTRAVAVAIPHLRDRWVAGLVQALVTEADQRGLTVSIEPCGDDPQRLEQVLINQLGALDGVVVVAGINGVFPQFPKEYRMPVCCVGGIATDGGGAKNTGVPVVRLDYDRAARDVLRHLRNLRKKRPLMVGTGADVSGSLTRAFLEEYARDTNSDGLMPVLAPPTGGCRAAGQDIGRRIAADYRSCDAVVCTDDDLALGVMSGLWESGMSVPGECVVTGCGDIDDGRFSTPTLTSVRFPLTALARAACEMLGQDRRAASGGREVTLAATLVRRESTLGHSSVLGGLWQETVAVGGGGRYA